MFISPLFVLGFPKLGSDTESAVNDAVRPFRAPPEKRRESLERFFFGVCSV